MKQLPLIAKPTEIQQLLLERTKLSRGLLAPNTVFGYAHDWKVFNAWCEQHRRAALPATPETVSLYLTDLLLQGRKVRTGARRASGIAHMHRVNGFASPADATIRALLRATQRLRCEQPRQKRPLSVAELRSICRLLIADGTADAKRDRALLLVGFASTLRRVNLAELLPEDVEFVEQGFVLHVRREKQDQEGRGRWIGVPFGKSPETCPVRALREWLDCRGVQRGPIFAPLTGRRICQIVQRCVKRIGLDPAMYGAHSLRAGFVTEAGEANANELLIATQTGHRSLETLRKYFRRRDLFKANACAMIGL